MDYKGRMDAYAIYSFSNLPDEVISAIRQRGVSIIFEHIVVLHIY